MDALSQPKIPANRFAVFSALVAVVCVLDLTTKSWMFAELKMPGPDSHIWWLWKGVFGFQTSLNEGALFGMGQGMWPLFAALSVGAAAAILVWLFAMGAARDWLLTIALALVTAGILGNLYDRLGLPGLTWNIAYRGHLVGEPVHAVRDFVLMMIGPWTWPNYNIADSSLVCGAALLMWHALFSKQETSKNSPSCMESY
jgi:signal peptidase II